MQEAKIPIKTKIATSIMIILGLLFFSSSFLNTLVEMSHCWIASFCSLHHYVRIIPSVLFLLLIIFSVFILKRKRWGWWGGVFSVIFCSIWVFFSVYKYEYKYENPLFFSSILLLIWTSILALLFSERKYYWEVSVPIKIKINQKVKFIGGIIVIIFAIAGWQVWEVYHPQGKVIISTDKTIYKIGEPIKLTVRNNLNRGIWYCDSGCSYWWGLEKFTQDGRWKNIPVEIPHTSICFYSPYCILLRVEPGSEISYLWDGRFQDPKKRSVVSLDPGVYRFNFEYRYGFRYAYKEKIIYSNVFKIQGRKEQKEETNFPEVKIPDESVILEKEATSTQPEKSTSTVEGTFIEEIDISDWKIYRNEEYGFELKYPPDWFVEKSATGEEIYFKFGEKRRIIIPEEGEINVEKIGLTIRIVRKESGILENLISERFLPLEEDETIEPITFGVEDYKGILVKKFKTVGVVKLIPRVFIKRNDSLYELEGEIPSLVTSSEFFSTQYNYDKVYNQMLSTFRFLE